MRRILAIALTMLLMLSLAVTAFAAEVPSGVEDGVLTIAMECAYAPYNWTQSDDSNGAVPIANVEGSYANGYDVMIAKKICEANGWQLEVLQSDWDSLVPGVQTGTFDAVIAGQSMTAERAEQVDFAGPYFYATIVCLTTANSPYANAKIVKLDTARARAIPGVVDILTWEDPDSGETMPTAKSNELTLLFIRASKETEIKSMIKGNLRPEPAQAVRKTEDVARMTRLYERAVALMEKKHPFLDAGFGLDDLATALFTNRAYLSKTINILSGRNFRQFVNYQYMRKKILYL